MYFLTIIIKIYILQYSDSVLNSFLVFLNLNLVRKVERKKISNFMVD